MAGMIPPRATPTRACRARICQAALTPALQEVKEGCEKGADHNDALVTGAVAQAAQVAGAQGCGEGGDAHYQPGEGVQVGLVNQQDCDEERGDWQNGGSAERRRKRKEKVSGTPGEASTCRQWERNPASV